MSPEAMEQPEFKAL
jgi:tetratricopeptide (TPR) repeat protein